jgi:hypothetical protein
MKAAATRARYGLRSGILEVIKAVAGLVIHIVVWESFVVVHASLRG